MSLLEQIKSAALTARKARNSEVALSLTTLVGEIETAIKNGVAATDENVTPIIKKFVKNINDTINRVSGEALVKLQAEKALYEQFLPKQLSNDELLSVIKVIISEGATNVGMVMKQLKAKYAGLYDGSAASALLKTFFQ